MNLNTQKVATTNANKRFLKMYGKTKHTFKLTIDIELKYCAPNTKTKQDLTQPNCVRTVNGPSGKKKQ